jgi:ribosomal protein S27AE
MIRFGAMQRKKIDLKKVLECLNTACPSCGYSITPAEIVRIDFERQKCPKCGETFDARKKLRRV